MYLTERDYGVLSITQSIALIIGVIAGLGINRSITRFMYYQTEKSKTNDASIIYTSLFASFGIQAAFVLLVILFNQYIPAKLLNDIDFSLMYSLLLLHYLSIQLLRLQKPFINLLIKVKKFFTWIFLSFQSIFY